MVEHMFNGFKKYGLRPMLKYVYNQGKQGLVGVEIGVDKGFHSRQILDVLPMKRLYCVDGYPEYSDFRGCYSWVGHYEVALENLRPFGDRVVFVNKNSFDAVGDVPDGLDFVYIDGEHTGVCVCRELELFVPKVRSGGVVGGHDFNAWRFPDYVAGICRYGFEHGFGVKNKKQDWWFQV